jgi:uncharacterized protein (TIGR03437 family)
MRNHSSALRRLIVIAASALASHGQVPLNPAPSRLVGHARQQLSTDQPNLVEGRELSAPGAVAVDTATNVIYVADTGNNRVLGWRNATSFRNGAPSDFVIGQRDKFSTFALGPGTSFSSGLRAPTGLAVDRNGHLYVMDAGNNRIVRYSRPAGAPADEPILADFIIGQPSSNSRVPNFNGVSERSLATAIGSGVFRSSIAFDAAGNLWVTDAGNHRVLRYPAASIAPGSPFGPSADVVLGQPDFSSNLVNQGLPPNSQLDQIRLNKSGMREPAALALDQAGRVYVSDYYARVLVYMPPYSTAQAAVRLMGLVRTVPGQNLSPINEFTTGFGTQSGFVSAEGIFASGNTVFVVDTPAHRILRFDPFEQWPSETVQLSPAARAVIGQDAFQHTSPQPNRGRAEPTQDTLLNPTGAVVAGGEVYVCDSGNNRVLAFGDLSTGPPLSAGAPYSARRVLGQNNFNYRSPNLVEGKEFFFAGGGVAIGGAIVVDTRSTPPRMYVVDTANNRVLGFADARRVKPGDEADIVIGQPDKFRTLINFPSNSPTQRNEAGLFFPVAAAVDRQGNLWVADSGNSRVLRFPSPFSYQGPQPMRADLVLGQRDFSTAITDATARTMAAPSGVAFTFDGGIVVSDRVHNRVLFFAPPFQNGMAAARVIGQPDFESIAPGTGDNRLNGPRHIATDTDDRLYVADTVNNRVQIFGRIPTLGTDPRAVFTVTGTGRIRNPLSVAVSERTGEIWVGDTGSNRAIRFPRFDQLISLGDTPNYEIPSGAPVGLGLDGFGNIIIADSFNRVALHFPLVSICNGANYLTRIAPGMVTTLSSQRAGGCRIADLNYSFTEQTKVFNELPNPLPLPTTLGDIQVLIDDQPVGIYFISPFQINFLMPNNAPSSGTVELQIIDPGVGRIIAAGRVSMDTASPAFFTAGSTGTGQIAALNEDGSINSGANAIDRGKVIQLFATGAGHVPGAPNDGSPPSGAIETPSKPRVVVGTRFVEDSDILYSGLAPGLVGVWQINIRIPEITAPSNAVIVVATMNDIPSNNPAQPTQIRTTIAVK